MKALLQFKKTTPALLIPLAAICFGLAPIVQAVGPDTDGSIAGANNGEGVGVLISRTTGIWNSGTGFEALNHLTAGNQNTATGVRALFNDINGGFNTATGVYSLYTNTSGFFNSATGAYSLTQNTDGSNNTANGYSALYFNSEGDANTATGFGALYKNTTGFANTANGYLALENNTTGGGNTAEGFGALNGNTIGTANVASGYLALLSNTTGAQNTAIGAAAGAAITTGDMNTCLGTSTCGNTTTADNVVCVGASAAGENFSNRAYIPNAGVFAQAPGAGIEFVTVRLSDGKLGHDASSRRYKEDIKPMDNASELIYKLKPVTFKFKEQDVDPNKRPEAQNLDYGLIAEEVAEIDPKLAIRDGKGQIESVRYKAIYNMMLNEFLKEHRKVQEQEATITQLKKEMETVVARLKEQDSKIQKVSDQLELRKPAPQVVINNP
jgi:hypothetical protein